MIYYLYFKNLETSIPKSGLSPICQSLIKVSNNGNISILPDVEEIGSGWYKFDITPAEDLVGVIDGGDPELGPGRYIEIYLSPSDAYLNAPISGTATHADIERITQKDDFVIANPISHNSSISVATNINDQIITYGDGSQVTIKR